MLEIGGLSAREDQARGHLPVRLAIADRSTAVCPLVADWRSGEPSAALIGRSQLLDALRSGGGLPLS